LNLADILKANEGLMEFDPQIVHHFSDGLYAKQFVLPKDHFIVQHAHKYSHLSLLAKGKVIVRTDNTEEMYSAPYCFEIKSRINHSIQSLEDCVWFCIHATDEKDPSKVDEVLIQRS